MIDVFWGGYLHHPAALDYSDDTCRHGCAYCFANINKGERKGRLKSAINFLHKKEPSTYMDALRITGYPICVSNRTDPFSPNNVVSTQALFKHLAVIPNGVFIQTKTGPGCEETVAQLGPKKAVVYITISILDPDTAASVEPFAPPPAERLAAAKNLIKAGYLVMVAINPCSSVWLPPSDFKALIDEFWNIGIRHVALEVLDMKPQRLKKMEGARVRRLGGAEQPSRQQEMEYVRECTKSLIVKGFAVAKKGMPFRSSLYNDIAARISPTMPTLQQFVNWCLDNKADQNVTFSDFASYMERGSKLMTHDFKGNNIRGYLIRSGFKIWKSYQQVHSHRELLRVIWNEPKHHAAILNHCLFRPCVKDGEALKDEAGNALLHFGTVPKGDRNEVFST